ncbi:DUF452 family protein [Thioclava sp. A2]|uniref:pimeloyl-ACP methyl esterase BioG family protein n=1 Tax=Thioclava sp. FCG-A2 TaxID=3080562 RepID=UPI0029555057|nr:pimeloyl-ACP methyl esterase BioG family protein [Thioclava sp. A2]MDV7269375.1 DUF452 family protein [Thioclava sp. A2]
MKTHWLCHKGTPDLILAFAGWGLGTGVFAPLASETDVLCVSDYRALDLPPDLVRRYARVHLLAYSFGVASALHWLARTGVTPARMVAVNGTITPASTKRGIDPAMIEATAAGLTPATLAAFARRSGHSAPPAAPDIPALQDELRRIAARGSAPERPFDRIWISARDRIIPPSAQETAWEAQSAKITRIDTPHQPFRAGQRWEDWFA